MVNTQEVISYSPQTAGGYVPMIGGISREQMASIIGGAAHLAHVELSLKHNCIHLRGEKAKEYHRRTGELARQAAFELYKSNVGA